MSSDHPAAAAQPGESSTLANTNPEVKQEELDASISTEIASTDPNQPDAMNLDGTTDMDGHNNNSSNNASAPGASGSAGLAPGQDPNVIAGAPPASELRIPTKKDASLREFLSKMDDYAPIYLQRIPQHSNDTATANATLSSVPPSPQIPDAVTNYYLTLAGLPPPPQTPPHLARLLALATQKFIADIAADAYQYSRIRSSNTTSNNPMGGLGGAAGFGMMGAAGGAAGGAGAAAGAAAAGSAGSKEGGQKGVNLGVQRPGYGGGGQGGSQGRTVLTMEDLGMAVGEYGVNVKRGEFYR
ncbi:Transcription initiation factor TFIID [Lasiodiplodia theobromae]|uniref:Transcription initiation factor TFIID n=1 Tax=Lasiodiplodia theobromae TaxID=45133 RepID=UPI0015C3437F|nr:Transcription initiation factor TFIID [Lasiodiplodia theobromae]KAF4535148.1 Transcription initiation factor TFIID [Lasiodiplodia theobromae]